MVYMRIFIYMAIKGHKERSLLRRGLYVEEPLKRRINLNELASLRRNLITESVDTLSELCHKEGEDSVYCNLKNKIQELGYTEQTELLEDLNVIHDFFTVDLKNNNQSVFKKVIKIILELDYYGNAIRVMASTMKKGHVTLTSGETLPTTKDSIRKALNNLISSCNDITEESLEELLKNVRMLGYNEYEKSFVGDNFEHIAGRWHMPNLDLENRSFWELISHVYHDRMQVKFLYKYVIRNIIKNKDEIFETAKADLKTSKPLMVGDKVILPTGSYIEVKKMDYATDSYMSEFYAIYKNSNLITNLNNDGIDEDRFLIFYNKIIDAIYSILNRVPQGEEILLEAESHIDAIMYDKNILIPRLDENGQKNFGFYWSNKGQRSCDKDHRLSIRFRPLKEKIGGFIYDGTTQLTPIDLSIGTEPKTKGVNYC